MCWVLWSLKKRHGRLNMAYIVWASTPKAKGLLWGLLLLRNRAKRLSRSGLSSKMRVRISICWAWAKLIANLATIDGSKLSDAVDALESWWDWWWFPTFSIAFRLYVASADGVKSALRKMGGWGMSMLYVRSGSPSKDTMASRSKS